MTPAITRGVRNHNPGNIERNPRVRWQGQAEQQTDPRFVVFEAARWGIRAIARVLITYQDKRKASDGSPIDTVNKIIHRWAPSLENDTAAYAHHVARLLDVGVDQTLDVYDYTTMRGLVEAIIAHENAGYRYPPDEIEAGLRLAGIEPPQTHPMASKTLLGAGAAVAGLVGANLELSDALEIVQVAAASLPPTSPAGQWLWLGLGVTGIASVIWDWVRGRKRGLN